MHLNPYIGFNDNCAEALKFYEKVLDAKVLATFKYGESPMAGVAGCRCDVALLRSRGAGGVAGLGGTVAIGARAEPGSIVITVEDNGVGISEGDLQRVGEPYFQARASYDRRHGGTGLGLSIVKGLVRLHGGELSIRSRVGEGTRVTVCLPLDCERTNAASRPTASGGHDSDDHIGYFKRPAPAASIAAPPAVSEIAPTQSEIVVKKSA